MTNTTNEIEELEKEIAELMNETRAIVAKALNEADVIKNEIVKVERDRLAVSFNEKKDIISLTACTLTSPLIKDSHYVNQNK
ncbi:hypothetical protein [Colwellia psychrerythraea]|uniref:Uncharacterized protein n=1 Tax=Colwellia psychrerythraea TaxID=28229 RepID=A0A099KHH2_COLPS|nr:hypothetical protein [Colwellia psychrerythraea]KGJ89806.1 hypothetical protein GAB14E_3967 [Colwellia psychrerythraea]